MSTTTNTTIIHGVFMSIDSVGTLITGKSGSGKSELALALIKRGHQLIADDAPEFKLDHNNLVQGSCPPLLDGYMHVPDLGFLNIRKLFGSQAIRSTANLQLIINLYCNKDDQYKDKQREILTINTDVLNLAAAAKYLELIVETAVKNHLFKLRGYDSNLEFAAKQRQFMSKDNQ